MDLRTNGCRLIHVSLSDQRCRLFGAGGELLGEWPVSASRYGAGFEEGSHRTPLGRFQIAGKIGEGMPPGTVFKAREAVGHHDLDGPEGERDLILSRILLLDGLDPENANTRHRYIYFHGTNQRALIGQPASIGCIRLDPIDMVALHDLVRTGDQVRISIDPPDFAALA